MERVIGEYSRENNGWVCEYNGSSFFIKSPRKGSIIVGMNMSPPAFNEIMEVDSEGMCFNRINNIKVCSGLAKYFINNPNL